MVKALKEFALANYEQGGHWIYETYDDADYEAALAEAEGDLERAKEALKDTWTLFQELEEDCANA